MKAFKAWAVSVGTVVVLSIVGIAVWTVRTVLPFLGLFIVACAVVGSVVGLAALVLRLRGMFLDQQVIHRGDVVVLRGRDNTLTHLSAIHMAASIKPDTLLRLSSPIVDASPTLPVAPTFASMQHEVSPERLVLGYGTQGAIYGSLGDLLSTAIVGRPNTGKSTLLRFAMAQVLMIGGTSIVIDPHGSIVDELGSLLQVAETGKEIDRLSIWLQRELEARLESRRSGKGTGKPLLLLADEWPIVASLSESANDAVRRIVLEGRKVGMFALISGQGLPANLLGGTLVRDALSSRYVFNCSSQQARMAGLENDTAKDLLGQLEVAGSGKAILATNRYKAEIVAVPNCTVNDIRSLLVPEHSHAMGNSFHQPIDSVPTFPQKEVRVVESVSNLERETILDLFNSGVKRSEICHRLGKSQRYYSVVKSVLDEYEQG